ncbi:insulin-like growth factor-binding protein-related protein 1 [Centruroides sculpturatus]|uniref:insulin-like growth factor-binding protein-related protein 1 n=1 Tax=Centruroides sculpturatus TaxID=218467 RepID=UPI000C6E88C6|nr:insulin-like growth factor-binding protein-related protein 1 [Centruroides sculpturatus]
MSRIVLCIFFCAGLLLCVETRKCPRCDKNHCQKKRDSDCPAGLVLDKCNCCLVCGKTLNQRCGGGYRNYGKCGRNLVCKPDSTSSDNASTCKKA